MDVRSRWWYLLPEPVRKVPADLAAVIGVIGLTAIAVFLPGVRDTPLRIVIGLPFVLFIPGYAFIAALFPEHGTRMAQESVTHESSEATDDSILGSIPIRDGIDGIERVALSFGTSIAVVPLLGLVLNFTPWGIRLTPIVVAVGGFALSAAIIASERRRALPPEDRFQVPYRSWAQAGYEELFNPSSNTDAVLNVVLVASLLLAVGSVGYAVAVPKPGESFTEFYLLTENESGALVADDYPTEFTRGESQPVTVGIGNHEHQRVNYSVVVELQRVSIQNNSTTVQDETELDRFQTAVRANETWRLNHTITPQMTGDRLRLTYLLYQGAPPDNPSIDTAYREVHLWVNVSASEADRGSIATLEPDSPVTA